MERKIIAVLGAGAVGVSTALYLQRDGHQVMLVDRDEPGMGCSFGNAGLIQCSSVLPVAAPGVLRSVPKMLLDPDQPLVLRWRHLLSLTPYLMGFLREAQASRFAANADALAAIIPQSYEGYRPLIEAAGLQSLVWQRGEMQVFKSRAVFDGAEHGRRMRMDRGVKVELLGSDDLRDLEPALTHDCRWGVLLPSSYQTADPYRLISGLARHFAAQGGTIVKATVRDVRAESSDRVVIRCDDRDVTADEVVVAFGAFSGPVAAQLGGRTPLNSERGYHAMLPDPGVELHHTIISGDYRFAMSPMEGRVRLAGTAELAKVGAPPKYERARRLIPLGQKLLPGLRADGATYWMGHRPSLPDSLPVIGASPRHPNVHFAFGHGHSGLTLGGITGRLIADLVAGREPPMPMAPYSVERFHG
jgi:glycine/D-amino acid oxidase-like deaminating enzyme